MHRFTNNIGTLGALRHEGWWLKWCGLCWLPLLFAGQMVGAGAYYAFGEEVALQARDTNHRLFVPTHFATIPQEGVECFDFENAPEPDPEPTGAGAQAEKTGARAAWPLFSWEGMEGVSTKTTLAQCAASLRERTVIPLFLLHHAWKSFPA